MFVLQLTTRVPSSSGLKECNALLTSQACAAAWIYAVQLTHHFDWSTVNDMRMRGKSPGVQLPVEVLCGHQGIEHILVGWLSKPLGPPVAQSSVSLSLLAVAAKQCNSKPKPFCQSAPLGGLLVP